MSALRPLNENLMMKKKRKKVYYPCKKRERKECDIIVQIKKD
jgi:hypothetical protein